MDAEIENLDKWKKASKIAAQALEFAKPLIVVKASLQEVTEKTEAKILGLGGQIAFPVQISLNETAAHYCAKKDDAIKFKEGDLVSIDIGVSIDGCIGDNALTVYLGNDENMKKLEQTSRNALNGAIKVIRPGVQLKEIGAVIEKTITSAGFQPVRNLSGHGLGLFDVHTPPTIPNYDNGDENILEEGQIIAIEPFATTGTGFIHEKGDAEVLRVDNKKPVRSLFTREILKELNKQNGLPFCKRWLYQKFHPGKVDFALREMENLGMLRAYPPLVEKSNGLVSQAEHTILITKDGCEILTKP